MANRADGRVGCAVALLLASGVVLVGTLAVAAWWTHPASGTQSLVVAGGLAWLVLSGVGVAVVLVGRRRIAGGGAVALVLVLVVVAACGIPAGVFWSVGVHHGPDGADCASCAVIEWLDDGPLGGYSSDPVTYDQSMCAGASGRLRAQATQIRREMNTSIRGTSLGLVSTESINEQITTHGPRATSSAT